MRMRKGHKILATAFALALAAGCVKDTLYDTPHPDQGVVSVSVDVPQGAEGDYTIEVDGTPLDKGATASEPLAPGEHTVLVYNTPKGFIVTDGIAFVKGVDAPPFAEAGASSASARSGAQPAAWIEPLPETLYSGTKTVTVLADDTLRVDLDVAQRTRDLRLELTVTEGDPQRITAITGTLSGVAGAYDLRSETLYGEAVSTAPAFTRNGDKIEADLRLLGMLGEAQVLTLVLTFTDGLTQTVESDLTEALANFNGDMEQTFTVTGSLRTPTEAGVGGCTITDWMPGGGNSGSAT